VVVVCPLFLTKDHIPNPILDPPITVTALD